MRSPGYHSLRNDRAGTGDRRCQRCYVGSSIRDEEHLFPGGDVSPVPGFSSMGAKKMKRLLMRELGYVEVRDSGPGSHTTLKAEGRPPIRWAFHDKRELAPIEVRRILVIQVGLTLDEARRVVQRA